jgi:hypothetical protein
MNLSYAAVVTRPVQLSEYSESETDNFTNASKRLELEKIIKSTH